MCKYCKKLKEINDLDKKSLLKIIQKWRRRDYEARRLLHKCLFVITKVDFNAVLMNSDFTTESFNSNDLFKDVSDFLRK